MKYALAMMLVIGGMGGAMPGCIHAGGNPNVEPHPPRVTIPLSAS